MQVGLIVAIGFALSFALTNGFHDASNAIATLVATRGATPGQAVLLSGMFNMAGGAGATSRRISFITTAAVTTLGWAGTTWNTKH